MISNTFIIFFLLLYAVIEGEREGLYYHEASKTKDTILQNSHPMFLIQRMCMFIILLLSGANILILISAIFMFSFFHDGCYYNMRNRLNPAIYPKKFFDHSTTSTAFFEFSFTWRLILFIIGLLLFITTLIYTT